MLCTVLSNCASMCYAHAQHISIDHQVVTDIGMLVSGQAKQSECHHLLDPLCRSEQLGARAEAEEEAA